MSQAQAKDDVDSVGQVNDKATASSSKRPASLTARLFVCLPLQVLAVVFSATVQLNLSPVYGDELLSQSDSQSIAALSTLIAFLINVKTHNWTDLEDVTTLMPYLPLYAAAMPLLLEFSLIPASSTLGPEIGPIFTKALSTMPILISTTYLTLRLMQVKGTVLELVVTTCSFLNFAYMEGWLLVILNPLMGKNFVFTRFGLQTLLVVYYSVHFPSSFLILIIGLFVFTLRSNPHPSWSYYTAQLNATLATRGFFLHDRAESLTGYVSVLESVEQGFRVLRCDHSLLGGEWIPSVGSAKQGITVPETVYPAFTILEAVRLMQPKGRHAASTSSGQQNSLVIGLGAGTCPKALSLHGINTTVVEIDPMVTKFARKYFGLPEEVTVVVEDALKFVERTKRDGRKFDYIVHDVFTGGAEPTELFTLEFLTSLRDLLTETGYIAINYAGYRSAASTNAIMLTIQESFSTRCRIYRDSPESSEASTEQEFLNMIVFCPRDNARSVWIFRDPVEADFLSSQSRRQNLPPKHQIAYPTWTAPNNEPKPLVRKGIRDKTIENEKKQSARRHWSIMREVLPSFVWEQW